MTFQASVGVKAAQIGSTANGRVLEEPHASLAFLDQETASPVVTVQSATLSRGGFLVLHRGSASGPVVGVSELLESGTHEAVQIALDEPVEGATTVVVVPHRDKNANNLYEPDTDESYVENGSIATDSAVVTHDQSTTPAGMADDETPPPIVVTKTVQVDSPMPQVVTETVVVTKTATPGQPGFGAIVALLALLGGGWLVVQRR